MGNLTSYDLADSVDLSLEQSITIQLRGNHYPPVPYAMVPICIEAIHAYNNGDYSKHIDLPSIPDSNGEPFQITWRGKNYAPANAIIEQHHLESWIEYDED